MPSESTHSGETAEPVGADVGADVPAPKRSWTARLLLIAAIAVGVVVVLGVVDLATASPALCGSCHEMAPRAEMWKKSPHNSVKCVKCHTAPHPWYAVPQAVVSQTVLLGRDVFLHFTNDYPNPVDAPVPGAKPMQDETCLQCHDVNRKATSGYRILIDHAKHAKRNGSCISCHVRTAHPLASRGTPLSLMSQCFTCHGTTAYPTASAKCGVCHPAGYVLKPTSHKSAKWARGHGVVAKADRKQCDMCHTKQFCTDCHGLEMPHPKGWAQGATGHGRIAGLNRAKCAKCHTAKPDLCSMCHHQGYDPAKGTWVKQHYIEVEARGAAGCMDCHSPVYCVRCHVKQPGQ